MEIKEKICYGFITIYIGITLYFMISIFLLINGLPIDDLILFFNNIEQNLDIESMNNIILRINDNFNYFYFTAQKISNVTHTITYFKDTAENINTQLNNYNDTVYYLTDNIDYFKNTAETINSQLTNYNDTIYYLTDNVDNFRDFSSNLNSTIFEIINTIRYFRNTAENINDQMYYVDNLNSTIQYFYNNMNNINNNIGIINNRLTSIENNIELILDNTNQGDVPDTQSQSSNNFINSI